MILFNNFKGFHKHPVAFFSVDQVPNIESLEYEW